MKPFDTLAKRGQLGRLRVLAAKILSGYDIPDPQLTPLRHEDNTTFRIDAADGERYVLRIHRPSRKTTEAVRSEMIWLTALQAESHLTVPQPVPNRAGELVHVTTVAGVPEPRMAVLLRWLPGRFLDKALTPAHLEQVGIFMARLQLGAAQFQPPADFVRGRLDNLYGKPEAITETEARAQLDNPADEAFTLRLVAEVCSAADAARLERRIGEIRAVQRAVGQQPDTFGLIHGDLHQNNYLFHACQVCDIDFDDCGYGYHLYDMAVTLFNVHWRDDAAVLRAGFLKGYRQVRPLSAAHEGYLSTFMDLRDIQMMIWAIEMRNHPAFRTRWQAEVKAVLDDLKKRYEGSADES
jgi:Ser/Thr protein kinase RdoA (MazF antagonist)